VHVQCEQIQDDACFHIAGALMKNTGCVLHKKHAWNRTINTLGECVCVFVMRVCACVHNASATHARIHHTLLENLQRTKWSRCTWDGI
jgi:hypothetical protein